MSDSVKKIKISSYDDLFSPTAADTFDDGTPAKVTLDKLIPFPQHPFKLYQDERMQEMVASVRVNGILTPILVRPTKDNKSYEIISGHNRVEAARQAGLEEMPAIIRQMDDETAIVAMIDSNLRQREQLFPSEKAFAYKMKLEAIKKQGKRTDLTSGQLVPKLNKSAREVVADEAGENYKQVSRYIHLTYLIPELLDYVDQGKLAFNPAVAISYISPELQADLIDVMNIYACSPSLAQADRMKKLSQEGNLDRSAINAILSEPKPQQKQIVFKGDQVEKYFPKDTSP
ncbi:MAG: ParB/RepB/Spo0J family partition protein, partial [Clostridiaceae bacterium]|nr:ParB/RepB/Spo0J family partition protein [Clostridiaceae bacterium]